MHVDLKPRPHQQQCGSNIVECCKVECCFDIVACLLCSYCLVYQLSSVLWCALLLMLLLFFSLLSITCWWNKDVQMLQSFQLQGVGASTPTLTLWLTSANGPRWGLLPRPRYRLALHARHESPSPAPPCRKNCYGRTKTSWNKRSKNFDNRPHRMSCSYCVLNDPFAAYTAAETFNAFQWAGPKIAPFPGGSRPPI